MDIKSNDLSNLIQETEIAALFLDKHFRIRIFTPAAAEIFHLRAHDIGRDIRQLTDSVENEDIVDAIETAARTQRLQEKRISGANGKNYLRQITCCQGENDICGFVLTFVDISKFIKAEKTRKEVQESLEILAANVQGVLWVSTPGISKMLYVSPAYEKLWGRSLESLYQNPQSFFEAIHTDDRGRVLQTVADPAQGDHSIEYRIVRPDGNVRWILDRGGPIRDDSGRIIRMGGFAADITQAKQTEESLRESVKMFRSAMEHAAIGKALVAPDGRWLKVNPALCRIIGYSEEELLASDFQSITHPDDLEADLDNVHRVLRGEIDTFQMEKRYVHKDGHIIWALLSVSLVRSLQGEPRFFISQIQDITDRKRAEREIRRLNTELEDKVQRRTAQLTATNKELEAFAYSVSHDLRAPLRAIDGFSQALSEDYADALDDTGMDYLRRVRAAAQRMAQLIDDLLALSRLSQVDIARRPIDIGSLARQVATDLQQREPKRQVEWRFPEELLTEGDPQLLRVALENLLGNAWKFTRHRSAAQIEVGRIDKDGVAVFFVRDNGAGFDMAFADKLFGPFQRLHDTRDFEGHGIGLATVQRIIHRHGGRIWAEAAPDHGATFYFSL